MSLKNDRLLKAIRGERLDRTPLWLMRQAGRYLPEYRNLRAKAGSFMNLCKTPEYACEATLQPLARFDLDAAILFSDILIIPDAMGLTLDFKDSVGPFFSRAVTCDKDIQELSQSVDRLSYTYEAIHLIKHELANKLPLIGFCGSPFTISAYMVEGKGQPGFPSIQKMMKEAPATLHQLLYKLSLAVSDHLKAQIEAGVDVVMIFDSWGGLLDSTHYQEFSLYYIKETINNLQRTYNKNMKPVILFTRGANPSWLLDMAESGANVLGLDAEISLKFAKEQVGTRVALQGNLEPSLLKRTPDDIRQEVKNVLASFGYGSGHLFNVGHGLTPDVPPEHVAVLVEAVHEESKVYHTDFAYTSEKMKSNTEQSEIA